MLFLPVCIFLIGLLRLFCTTLHCCHVVPAWRVCLDYPFLGIRNSFRLGALKDLDWPLQLNTFLVNHQAPGRFAYFLGLDYFLSDFITAQDLFDIVLNVLVLNLVRDSSESLDIQQHSLISQALYRFKQLLKNLI